MSSAEQQITEDPEETGRPAVAEGTKQDPRPTSSTPPASEEDLEFMSDTASAVLLESPRGGRLILWMAFLFVAAALAWANWATLDEVTSGIGQVIPSKHIQVIQNLEGGILAELLVKEGDTVEEGQVLLQIDDTRFSSSLRETRLAYYALKAKAARLQAEVSGGEFQVPGEVKQNYPEIVDQERSLFATRKKELAASRSILEEQRNQIRQELRELEAKRRSLERTLKLARKELSMTRPLVAAGAVSEVEVLRLERTVSELEGELEAARLAIPRTRSRLAEAEKKIAEVELRFRNEAHAELNEVEAELSKLGETSVALEDRVKRTAVRSPVKGTVKRIMVNTIGGVIQPGMDLMEIVPLEDYLLVEARVRPQDIAFLHPGQPVVVKITAYDFAIYGGLEGELEHISADTIEDEVDGERYYLVRVRTRKTHLGSDEHPLPIISGMQAEVDILTGKKTVMDYLLKPVLRARQKALRER